MKKFTTMLLVLAMLLSVSACASKPAPNASQPAGGETKAPVDEFKGLTVKASISLAANPIGQSSYQQAAAIADAIKNSGSLLEVAAEATNGYAENVGLIANNEVEIAFTNNLMLSDGYYARGDYEGLPKGKTLGVISLSCNKTHVIVPADSKITEVSYEAFKGKKIGIGQVGGTSRIDALNLMDALGLKPADYTGYEVKGAEQTEMMKNGQLDVFIWNGKAPIATVVDLVTTKKCRFLPVPQNVIDTIIKNSEGAYTKQFLFKDYYESMTEDVLTYGNNAVLFASSDVPEEVVYEFTKRFVENLEALGKANKSFTEIKPELMLEGISVPLHPGALRYFKEIKLPGLDEFIAKYQK